MPKFIYSVVEKTIYTVAVDAASQEEADELVYQKCDEGEYYCEDGYVDTRSEYQSATLLKVLPTDSASQVEEIIDDLYSSNRKHPATNKSSS